MTNFEGISAKIRRADDQINSLKSDMDGFCEDIRQSIAHEVRRNVDEQVWVFSGATPNVPIEWSVRLGEILYNLRSALDHLVWQLVLANGQKPGPHNAFPIVNNRCDWQGTTSNNKLKGVTPRVKAMVEHLQPYTGGINLPFNVAGFWTLHSLCNIDKHRHLIFAIVGSSGLLDPIIFGHNQPPLDRPSSRPPLQGQGRLGKIEKGQVMLRLNDAGVEIEPNFQIDIRFEDIGEPEITAGTVLRILHKCLGSVQGAAELLMRHRG